MSRLHKVCVAFLAASLSFGLLSHVPATSPEHWFLRVGFPEIGWIFWVLALLPTAALYARYRLLALGLNLSLLLLVGVPWIQSVSVASKLTSDWSTSFSRPQSRHPLWLGKVETYQTTTEEYAPGLLWDRYQPTGSVKARLLFVHGGSWRNGARDEYTQLFRYLAGRGYEVLSVTYTLSGVAPYPAAALDIEAAMLKAQDPKLSLFLAGRSSGGHLALLGAYSRPELVKGVIAFYAPVDMVWSYENPSNPNVLNSQEAIVAFMDGHPTDQPKTYSEASPLVRVGSQSPATLLIHGVPDGLVYHRQSEMLAEKLTKHQVPHYLLSLPWMEHGGDITIYGPSGRLSAWAIESFVDSLSKHPAGVGPPENSR